MKGFPVRHWSDPGEVENFRDLLLHGLTHGTTIALTNEVRKANGFKYTSEMLDAFLGRPPESGCGAVDAEDLDACGACADCTRGRIGS
jgi:hypothetical protein